MRKLFQKIIQSKGWLAWLLLGLAGINYLASDFHYRFDLTKENRYTLSRSTRDLLKQLEGQLEIDVFLKGQFPAGFKKLSGSTADFLRLLKDRSGKVQYHFISPQDEMPGTGKTYADSLVALGAVPINLTVQKKAEERSNIIFPVALLRYKGKQTLVNLYPGASGRISQEEINSAEALMEYQFASALDKMMREQKPGIAYSVGNGEPVDGRTYDLVQLLEKDYDFRILDLNKQLRVPEGVDLLLIVKPTIAFTEDEKLKIDQFVMNGGKLLCFIDNLIAEQDSLALKPETIAYDRNLNLTDLFFRYGLRLNPDLLMDLQCDMLPMVVGGNSENPQLEFLHWNYYPLLSGSNNPVHKNLGYVAGRFVNSMDTIQVPGIRKTPLLLSSAHSRTISTPALISLNENKNVPEDVKFRQQDIPAALLLEGAFSSAFRNRATKAQRDSLAAGGQTFRDQSPDNKMIVVADGDIVLNDFLPGEGPNEPPVPLPMGWNRYTYREYARQSEMARLFIPVANRDFLNGCIGYLVSNPAISSIRNKEIVLRLLDSRKVEKGKPTWQVLMIGLPVAAILLFAVIYQQLRRRKYAA